MLLISKLYDIAEIVMNINNSVDAPCGCCVHEKEGSSNKYGMNISTVVQKNENLCSCQVDIKCALVQILSTIDDVWSSFLPDGIRTATETTSTSVAIVKLVMSLVGCVDDQDRHVSIPHRLAVPSELLSIGAGQLLSSILFHWSNMTASPPSDDCAFPYSKYALEFCLFCLNDFYDEVSSLVVPELLVKSGLAAIVSRIGLAATSTQPYGEDSSRSVCSAILYEISQRCAGNPPEMVPYSLRNGLWTRLPLAPTHVSLSERTPRSCASQTLALCKLHQLTLVRNPCTQWHQIVQNSLSDLLVKSPNRKPEHVVELSGTDQLSTRNEEFACLIRAYLSLCLTPQRGVLDSTSSGVDTLASTMHLPSVNTVCFDMRTQGIAHLWLSDTEEKDDDDEIDGEEFSLLDFGSLNMSDSVLRYKFHTGESSWRGALYLALVRSDLRAITSILSAEANLDNNQEGNTTTVEELIRRKKMFNGYGPWVCGHPLNCDEGLSLPCSVMSAAKQLLAKSFVSREFVYCLQSLTSSDIATSSSATVALLSESMPTSSAGEIDGDGRVSPANTSSLNHTTVTQVSQDESNRSRHHRRDSRSRRIRPMSSSPRGGDMETSPSSQHSLASSALAISTTTAATIAAIRSLVRDEHLRMLQLTAAVGINVDNILRSLRLQSQVIEQHQLQLMSDFDPTRGTASSTLLESGTIDRGYLLPKDAGLPLSLSSRKQPDSHVLSRYSNVPVPSMLPVTESTSTSLPTTESSSRAAVKPLCGPSKFLYTKANGTKAYFDATYEACAPFGFFHGQTVRSFSFPGEIGVGVVIGVLNGYLWIHLLERSLIYGNQGIADVFRMDRMATRQQSDSETSVRYFGGATFREDNWRFADLYVVDVFSKGAESDPQKSTSKSVSSTPNPFMGLGLSSVFASIHEDKSLSTKPDLKELLPPEPPSAEQSSASPVAQTRLVVGDRVRRGIDWQWRDQDGQIGNLGTVVRVGCRTRRGHQVSSSRNDLPVDEGNTGCWVFVEWDSSGALGGNASNRNSYRWGVDGSFDLEKVGHVECDSASSIEVDVLTETNNDTYDNMVKYALVKSGVPLYADFDCPISREVFSRQAQEEVSSDQPHNHEMLMKDEQLRSVLWKTEGFCTLISTFIRLYYASHRDRDKFSTTVPQKADDAKSCSLEISKVCYYQLIGAAVLLSSRDTCGLNNLGFTVSDVVFFLTEVEVSSANLTTDKLKFENAVNCAKLLSILSSTGSMFAILNSSATKDELMSLFERVLASLVRQNDETCESCKRREKLTYSMLRFIHDMLLFAVGIYSADCHVTADLESCRRSFWIGLFGDDSAHYLVNNLLDVVKSILESSPSASAMTLSVDIILALVFDSNSPDVRFVGGEKEVVQSNCSEFSVPLEVFQIVMSKSIDEVLVKLAERLRGVVVTPSSHVAQRIVSNAMLVIENRAHREYQLSTITRQLDPIKAPSAQLLSGILGFAENTRDFACILDLMKSHLDGQLLTLCKCIAILLGGKKRPKQRQSLRLKKSLQIKSDASSVSRRPSRGRNGSYNSKHTTSWRKELRVGSCIDAKDKSHHWYEAIVKDTRRRQRNNTRRRKNSDDDCGDDDDSSESDEEDASGDWEDALGGHVEVFVHYSGWGDKYDEWIPCSSDRLQCAHTETGYWREHLRLDEPIEILCLHYETPPESDSGNSVTPEVKRRWFRGVVARIEPQPTGVDRILVVYDKRGCREERWIDIDEREEICKVGTHVPSSLLGPLGYNGDLSQYHTHSHLLLKGARKKELLESGSMESFLNLLAIHIDQLAVVDRESDEAIEQLDLMQHTFEALSFLLPSSSRWCSATGGGGGGEGSSNSNSNSNLGGDNMMSNSSRLCALSTLNPADVICKCLSLIQSSGYLKRMGGTDKPRVYILAEDIVDTACDILASLAMSQDAQVFSVGDAVEAQWRRRGNVSFPGRIARIRDYGNVSNNITSISSSVLSSNIAFDIHYDDGDREERIPMDRVTHLSSVAYYNASDFLSSFVTCEGPLVLWNILTECGNSLPEDISISILSALSCVIESMKLRAVAELFWDGVDWESHEESWLDDEVISEEASVMNESRPYAKVLLNMLAEAASVKSSSRLVMHILNFYRVVSESSVLNKNRVYATGVHVLSIQCLSAFPHHPKVLCQALNLLSAIVSKDGMIEAPECLSSAGPSSFSPSRPVSRRHYWQSEDRVPSADAPHWIDICLPPDREWREVQVLLSDYGSASPELVVVKYISRDALSDEAEGSTSNFIEIKRANVSGAEGWVTLVSRGEVLKALEERGEGAPSTDGGAVRLEIIRNQNDGAMSCVGDIRLMMLDTSHSPSRLPLSSEQYMIGGNKDDSRHGDGVAGVDMVGEQARYLSISEDERKDSIAALDGVSMVVECLVQSKTNDRDQYHCGKHFLQVFASDETRAQFIIACGGGYII